MLLTQLLRAEPAAAFDNRTDQRVVIAGGFNVELVRLLGLRLVNVLQIVSFHNDAIEHAEYFRF